MNGRTLIYKFKFLTRHNLNVNEIIKKFIDVLSVEGVDFLARKFQHENILDILNWTSLIDKNPKTFKYLNFDKDTLVNFHSVIEKAIKLDYKNFQYVLIRDWRADQYTSEIYAEFLDLAMKAYKNLKCKGVHPASFLQNGILSTEQLKRIITHKVDGKDQTDYVNIFKYGYGNVRLNRCIYVKALNIDSKLAKLYPISKKSSKKSSRA